MFAATWATVACLLVNDGSQPAAAQDYTVPTPTISVLSPRGIRFEIAEPNADVVLIAYHYSINVAVPGTLAGRWNYDVAPQDGKFVHENQQVRLNNGDTVHYWVYALYNGLGFQLLNKQWTYSVETPSLSRSSSVTASTTSTTLLGGTQPLSRSSSVTASTASTTLLLETSPINRISSTTALTASMISLDETVPLIRTSLAIASAPSSTSLGAAATPSTTVAPVLAATPTAGVREGCSTTYVIILGVALGVAVVLVAILSIILVLRTPSYLATRRIFYSEHRPQAFRSALDSKYSAQPKEQMVEKTRQPSDLSNKRP